MDAFCHNCNTRPPDGIIETDDGELKCSSCNEIGFIEIEEPTAFVDTNVTSPFPGSTSALPRLSTIPFPLVTTQHSEIPQLQRIPVPSAQQQPFGVPASFPTNRPLGRTTFSSQPVSTGFRVQFSENETRLTPGLAPPPLYDPFGTAMMFGAQRGQRQPLAFTATMNNVEMTQVMGSLFAGLGQFADVVGLDHVIQFIMEHDTNRFGSPPASAAVVSALPEESLTPETATGDCAICQDDFKTGDKVKRLSPDAALCPHMFHTTCVTPWLTEHNSCPICRFELPTDDPDYERRRLMRQQHQQSTSQSQSQTYPLPYYAATQISLVDQFSPPQQQVVTDEQMATEQLTTEQLTTEQPAIEQSITEQSITEQSITEQSITEQSITEQSNIEQSDTEQVVIEQSDTDFLTVEKSAAEQGCTDELAAEESAIEQLQHAEYNCNIES